MINLVEELVLLTIQDDGAVAFTAGGRGFQLGVIGACLVELGNAGRIDADLQGLQLLSREPTGNAALDLVLAEIAQGPQQEVTSWLRLLAPHAPQVVRHALASLAARGVLAQREARFLWVLKSRRYPLLDDGREQKEAKLRILETLLGDDLPTPHDSVLIGLARAGGVLEGFLSHHEIARLDSRLEQVGGIDLFAKGVETVLREDQERLAQSLVFPIG